MTMSRSARPADTIVPPVPPVPDTPSSPPRFALVERDVAAQATTVHRMLGAVVGVSIIAAYLALRPDLGNDIFNVVWSTTLGSSLGFSQLVNLTGALILAGIANAIALRAGMWNLGVEGQLYMGSWAATAVAFTLGGVSSGALLPLMLIAGILGGAAWSSIAGLLKAFFGASELVVSLLLNFIALFWMAYWVNGPWNRDALDVGALAARKVPEGVMLPHFHAGGVSVGLVPIVALVIALAMWFVFRQTTFGYSAGVLGAGDRTAMYAGVSGRRLKIKIMALSGGVAGLLGVLLQLDGGGRYSTALSNNTGYLGIAVAVLAGSSLIGVVLTGALLGFVTAAGNGLRIAGVSGDVLLLFTGLLLFCAAVTNAFARYTVTTRGILPSWRPRKAAAR